MNLLFLYKRIIDFKYQKCLFMIVLSCLIIMIYLNGHIVQIAKVTFNRGDTCNVFNIFHDETFSINIDGENYPKFIPLYYNQSINFECLNKRKNILKILLWTEIKGAPLQIVKPGPKVGLEEFNCPITNCEFTYNRSQLSESDMVLFHMRQNFRYPETKRSKIKNRIKNG